MLFETWSGRYVGNLLEVIYPLEIIPVFFQSIPFVTLGLLWSATALLLMRFTGLSGIVLAAVCVTAFASFAPSIDAPKPSCRGPKSNSVHRVGSGMRAIQSWKWRRADPRSLSRTASVFAAEPKRTLAHRTLANRFVGCSKQRGK